MSITPSNSSFLTDRSQGTSDEFCFAAGEFEMIGSSDSMKRLRLQVRRIGPHFRTVLITGAAGSSKELAARALHDMSRAASGPFVVYRVSSREDAIHECGALEEASARTANAMSDRVKVAQRGTLFLDGVSEMPLAAQLYLLRILRRQEAVQGSVERQPAHLQVIAATSENLKILVSARRFHQELYQRLSTVEIALPSLYSRREDLPELVEHLLNRLAPSCKRCSVTISTKAMAKIQSYPWPGDVSELTDALRISLLRVRSGVLEPQHLPLPAETVTPPSAAPNAVENTRLQDVVDRHVLRVLKDCGGNKLRAAEMLGISRSTLYRMLEACAPPMLQ